MLKYNFFFKKIWAIVNFLPDDPDPCDDVYDSYVYNLYYNYLHIAEKYQKMWNFF